MIKKIGKKPINVCDLKINCPKINTATVIIVRIKVTISKMAIFAIRIAESSIKATTADKTPVKHILTIFSS